MVRKREIERLGRRLLNRKEKDKDCSYNEVISDKNVWKQYIKYKDPNLKIIQTPKIKIRP